ncbi:hypothetical protein MRX96_012852 [Rhipicephalus microplus]
MGLSIASFLFIAALLVVQSVCVGSLFLPFGPALTSRNQPFEELEGRRGLPGHDVTTTTTTEKTEIKVPISALQNVLNVNEEQKLQIDLLFAFLKEIDDRGCVSRMVCESTADALRLGKVGTATKHFFDTNMGVGTKAISVFVAAAKTGRSRGLAGCAQAFPECTTNLPRVLTAAGLM